MIKVGQRVFFTYDSTKKGVVVSVSFVKPRQYTTTGTTHDQKIYTVKLDNGQTLTAPYEWLTPDW
jgi:hypothetical protein